MKKGKRLWAILMTTILVVTPMDGKVASAAVLKAEDTNETVLISKKDTKVLTDQIKSELEKTATSSNQLMKAYGEDEMVDIIVELKEDSLLETFEDKKSQLNCNDFENYISTSAAVSETDQILSTQNNLFQQIKKLDIKSNVTKVYNYTTVLNGFSIKVRYGLLDDIKKMKEVKNAFIAPTYELISPTMSNSVPYIGADKTWNNAGLKGEGMVVAIVDTGLDISHEAFQYAPSNPRISQNNIESIIKSAKLSASQDQPITSSLVYQSSKIPYAYDYADHDTNVSGGDSHGTHVAGTVAASGSAIVVSGGAIEIEKGILGVAPEAQLMILKVFSDTDGGASTTVILAALDDAVKLGTDVINMSLGSGAGFTAEGETVIGDVYRRIKEAGVNLVCAAGNDYSMSYNNSLGGKTLTENPDTSVVGSPSTYEAALSVASLKNSGFLQEQFIANNKGIIYTDNANKGEKLTDKLSGSYEFVEVGMGTTDEYIDVDVNGKIALISRGNISFTEKEANAYAAGAIAAVIYNNKAGTISMSVDRYDIPTVSITQEDGLYLLSLKDKYINMSKENSVDISGYASDYSSWGVTPDLKLKPEIAAPGEGIYSSVPGGYETMNGTSMASPHIAGASALVKEYINKSFTDLSKLDIETLTNQIMMSTATPMINKASGLPFSPRKQGAGMVNIYNAVTTGAYLYVEGSDRTKIEFGDDIEKSGIYHLEFHVRNISGSAITYNINTTTLTEGIKDQQYIAESEYSLSPTTKIQAYGGELNGENLTLEAGQDAVIMVTLTLSDSDRNYLDSNFKNGEFIEGFIRLDSEVDVDLSIPFMGYYGDWTSAPIMDSSSLYDGGVYSQTSSEAYNNVLGMMDVVLGDNLFAYLHNVSIPIDKNKIAISPNKDGLFDSIDYVKSSLLRNVKNIDYRVTDESGKIMYQYNTGFERKSFYLSSAGIINYALNTDTWAGTDNEGNVLENNSKYLYKVTGELDYDDHISNNQRASWEFPVTVDTEGPMILDSKMYQKDGRTYIDVDVSDNQYVAAVSLYSIVDDSFDEELASTYLNEETKGDTTKVTFDITDLNEQSENISDTYGVMVLDYAVNESDYAISYNVENISFDKETLNMAIGEEATLTIKTASDIQPYVTWESSDNTVASVNNGGVKALKAGTTTITATTLFGKTATCKVKVKEVAPTTQPTVTPTTSPTTQPTVSPTTSPTTQPTVSPTTSPTTQPTVTPTTSPTTQPTVSPTTSPTAAPTSNPTTAPVPTTNPTSTPKPSLEPTKSPVPDPKEVLDKVTVKLSSKTLYVGNSRSIVVDLPEQASGLKVEVKYSSSKKSIANVNDKGKITAIAKGKATITTTVTVAGVSKIFKTKITIKKPYIGITQYPKTLKVGKTYVLLAKAYGISGDIRWSVSDAKYATIDRETGKLTAIKKGTVYITASIGKITKKIKIKIV